MADKVTVEPTVESNEGIISSVFNEIVQSPVNSLLVALIVVLIYKIFKNRDKTPVEEALPPALPKLRRDFTPSELREYSSKQADGRILVGINGHVFDVSKGRKFYGPGKYAITVHNIINMIVLHLVIFCFTILFVKPLKLIIRCMHIEYPIILTMFNYFQASCIDNADQVQTHM